MVGDIGGAALDPVGEADRGAQCRGDDIAQLDKKGIARGIQYCNVKGDICIEGVILTTLGELHALVTFGDGDHFLSIAVIGRKRRSGQGRSPGR